MRGQALAIAMVIASGVATFVMARSTLDSLRLTQSTFYRDHRFAQVFAFCKRAPMSLGSSSMAVSMSEGVTMPGANGNPSSCARNTTLGFSPGATPNAAPASTTAST